jgi:hypothetical protein
MMLLPAAARLPPANKNLQPADIKLRHSSDVHITQ